MNKDLLDLTALGTLVGVLADILTVWASCWTIIWLSIRMYESKTVQGWLKGKHDAED